MEFYPNELTELFSLPVKDECMRKRWRRKKRIHFLLILFDTFLVHALWRQCSEAMRVCLCAHQELHATEWCIRGKIKEETATSAVAASFLCVSTSNTHFSCNVWNAICTSVKHLYHQLNNHRWKSNWGTLICRSCTWIFIADDFDVVETMVFLCATPG